MRIVSADEIIEALKSAKYSSSDVTGVAFNLGIEKAIDIISNAPTLEAKVKVDKKKYQREYYQRVTKFKRQQKREAKKSET